MSGDKHEKALDLTEAALEKLQEGDEPSADKLLERAKSLDPTAPKEILDEIDEDARARSEQ